MKNRELTVCCLGHDTKMALEMTPFATDLIEDLARSQALPFTEGQLKEAEADHISFAVWE